MSEQEVIDALVVSAKKSKEISSERNFGVKERIGQFVTTLRRELSYAGVKDRDICKTKNWKDILRPSTDVPDNILVYLCKRAQAILSEDADWDMCIESPDEPLVLSRAAWKLGRTAKHVHYAFADNTRTLCDMKLFTSDVPVQMVKDGTIIQCNCARCNAVMEAAISSGTKVVIARVKKKEETPSGCVRYVCSDCSQTMTVYGKKQKPSSCFQCKGTNIVRDGDVTIKREPIKRWVCENCQFPAFNRSKPATCSKCGSTKMKEDANRTFARGKGHPNQVKKYVCSNQKCGHVFFQEVMPVKCHKCGKMSFYLEEVGPKLKETWEEHVQGLA
jgi:hypothetical protein